jgi:hypothetical protein
MKTKTEPRMTVAELNERMAVYGITDGVQLAARLGVSPVTTWRWLKNKAGINPGWTALIRQKLP